MYLQLAYYKIQDLATKCIAQIKKIQNIHVKYLSLGHICKILIILKHLECADNIFSIKMSRLTCKAYI